MFFLSVLAVVVVVFGVYLTYQWHIGELGEG
jgi:hypothetical protein